VETGSRGDRGQTASSGTIPRTALRYEQLCRLRGALRLGTRQVDLDALGMRAHRRNSASIYASGGGGHSSAPPPSPRRRGWHPLAYLRGPKGELGSCHAEYFDGERYHAAEVRKFPYYSGVAGPEAYELELSARGETIRIRGEGISPYLRGSSKDQETHAI